MNKPSKRLQHEAFIAAARDLACDESEDAFNVALKKVARQKPPPDAPAPKPETKKPAK